MKLAVLFPDFLSLPIIGCLCLSHVIVILHASVSESSSFIFNGFDGQNISLSGIAEVDGGLIRLTNTSCDLFGRAFYPYPIRIKDVSSNVVSSFSSTFVFCITPSLFTFGGNGMAFVMSPSLDSSGIYPSQYLGMLSASDNGKSSNHVFGIEFDTVRDPEFEDINDNHVGINLNSMVSTSSTASGYWTSSQNASKTVINLKSGDTIQAWIDYDGHRQQLNVSIAPTDQTRPHLPLLSVNLSLSDVLNEYTYVGFSGSTNEIIAGTHRVLSWSFNSNGVAKSLDLSKLPPVFPKPSTLDNIRSKHNVSGSGGADLRHVVQQYPWTKRP